MRWGPSVARPGVAMWPAAATPPKVAVQPDASTQPNAATQPETPVQRPARTQTAPVAHRRGAARPGDGGASDAHGGREIATHDGRASMLRRGDDDANDRGQALARPQVT